MSHADAAIYYWQDSSAPSVAQPTPKPHRAKVSRRGEKKSDIAVQKEAKPQAPLIISISIAQQKLRLYDAHGLFAEAPVSTGMPGHATPMGVFSVIQKQKLHHSNIYSGAPMPFMQRITWSGVAMHAGVLPGHPASHGCIRMPTAFAVKLYGWTKMGARVIVTPGDVTPANFSHPLLATVKVVPQPVAVEETKSDAVAAKVPEKPAQVEGNPAPAVSETNIELRPTVGHTADAKPAADENRPAPSPLVQTADASGALPASSVSDSAPAGEAAPKPAEAAASATDASTKAAAEVDRDAVKRDEAAAGKIADGDAKSADAAGVQPSTTNGAVTPVENAKSAATTPTAEAPKAKTDTDIQPQKPAITAQEPPPSAPLKDDLKSDFAKAVAKPAPAFAFKKAGQIAIFVSRKDSKLYIRQDFVPLFDMPVTIAADTRPLGTHIFTAQVDGSDANVLHWSVVSLPSLAKSSEPRAEMERSARGRKFASAGPIEAKPAPMTDSPSEALDRLSLPAEVMAKIYEAVSTGGSIIVSDQGITAGETGEGTDFIVSLR